MEMLCYFERKGWTLIAEAFLLDTALSRCRARTARMRSIDLRGPPPHSFFVLSAPICLRDSVVVIVLFLLIYYYLNFSLPLESTVQMTTTRYAPFQPDQFDRNDAVRHCSRRLTG